MCVCVGKSYIDRSFYAISFIRCICVLVSVDNDFAYFLGFTYLEFQFCDPFLATPVGKNESLCKRVCINKVQ